MKIPQKALELFEKSNNESEIVSFIEEYLQTEEQRKKIFKKHLSIEKILNGRYTFNQEDFVEELFSEWNKKLLDSGLSPDSYVLFKVWDWESAIAKIEEVFKGLK